MCWRSTSFPRRHAIRSGISQSHLGRKSRKRASNCPPGKDRVLASYETGGVRPATSRRGSAWADGPVPDMPLFLANNWHVPVPLESTYQSNLERHARKNCAWPSATGVMAGTGWPIEGLAAALAHSKRTHARVNKI